MLKKTYHYVTMARCGSCALLTASHIEPFKPENLNAEYIVAIMPNNLRSPVDGSMLKVGDKIFMEIGASVQVWSCPNNKEIIFVESDFATCCREYRPKEAR